MGIGDEIMASGHARSEHMRTGRRVVVTDLRGQPRWSEVWHGLSWMVQPGERGDFARVQNGPQCRPYITYPFTRDGGQVFSGWRARDHMGAIALTGRERELALRDTRGLGEFIVLEPNQLPKSNPNKQWGWANWQKLADILCGHFPLVQLGPPGTRVLRGARLVVTPSFRRAAAVIQLARACVLTEGGLHHAAAVQGISAVVLFGGAVDPQATGYDIHVNVHDEQICGRWTACPHCARFWAALRPEKVQSMLRGVVASRPVGGKAS